MVLAEIVEAVCEIDYKRLFACEVKILIGKRMVTSEFHPLDRGNANLIIHLAKSDLTSRRARGGNPETELRRSRCGG